MKKWAMNHVEHRLFPFLSSDWRGEPLKDYETVVSLIARTTTAKGLKVTCRLDRRRDLRVSARHNTLVFYVKFRSKV